MGSFSKSNVSMYALSTARWNVSPFRANSEATTLLLIASNSFDRYTGGVSSSFLSGMDISCDAFPDGGAERASCGCGEEVRDVELENGGSLSRRIRSSNIPPKLFLPLPSPCCSNEDMVELRPRRWRLPALSAGEPGLERPEFADAIELDRRTGTLLAVNMVEVDAGLSKGPVLVGLPG